MAELSDVAGFGGYEDDMPKEDLFPLQDETESTPNSRKERKISEICQERDRLRDYWSKAHEKYSQDYRFANGEQYDNQDDSDTTQNDIYVREVYNVTDGLITPLVNGIRKAPPAISIYPAAEGVNDDQAQDIGGAIRAIEYDSHAVSSYCYALDCAMRGGMGVWRTIANKRAKMEIETEPILDPTTVYPDDRAVKPGFIDGRIVHHSIPFPADRFKIDFPGATLPGLEKGDEGNEVTSESIAVGISGTVTVWELWELVWDKERKEDALDHYIYTDREILSSELGMPLHTLPYHFALGKRAFVDGHTVFYGVTNCMRSSQKGINFFLSEAANHLATHPKSKIYGDVGALTPEQESRWAASAYDPDYFLEKQPGKEIAFVPLPEAPTGFVEIADKFADMMRLCSAIYADSSVQEGLIKQSGEAIKQQISQANLGAYHIIDSLKTALHHCGECYLDIISAYWQDDSIRVSRSVDGRTSFVSIGPSEIPSVKNVDAAYGKFGVSISSGPSYDSQFEAMMDQLQQLIAKGGEFAPALLVFWLQNIPIPGAENMAQIIRAYLPPQIQSVLDVQAAKNGTSPTEALQQVMSQLQTAHLQVIQLSKMVQATQQANQQLQTKIQSQEVQSQEKLQIARERSEADLQNSREERESRKELEEIKAQVALLREALIGKREKQLSEMETERDLILAQENAGRDTAASVVAEATR